MTPKLQSAANALSLTLAVAAVLVTASPARAQDLAIVDAEVHQYQGGPPVSASQYFLSLDKVYLSVHVDNVSTKDKEDDVEFFQLQYHIQSFDPDGVPLAKPVEQQLAADITPQDRKNDWMPQIDYDVTVPAAAPSGVYKMQLEVTDQLNDKIATLEVPFTVRGRRVEPSDTIVTRNFQFLRSELDTEPLEVAAYRAGDTLWARFDITGYKFAENNGFSVNYGIQIKRGDEVMFTQDPAAYDAEDSSFYPERYVMGGPFSLSLQDDLQRTQYTLVLTVRDLIGEQTSVSEYNFYVD